MAEYCEIRGRFRHPDAAMRALLVNPYHRCGVAQEFLPLDRTYLRDECYGLRREVSWGTQQDFGQVEFFADPVRRGNKVELHFETVGNLPLGVFIELRHLEFAVDAEYWEPFSGLCGFVGTAHRTRSILGADRTNLVSLMTERCGT